MCLCFRLFKAPDLPKATDIPRDQQCAHYFDLDKTLTKTHIYHYLDLGVNDAKTLFIKTGLAETLRAIQKNGDLISIITFNSEAVVRNFLQLAGLTPEEILKINIKAEENLRDAPPPYRKATRLQELIDPKNGPCRNASHHFFYDDNEDNVKAVDTLRSGMKKSGKSLHVFHVKRERDYVGHLEYARAISTRTAPAATTVAAADPSAPLLPASSLQKG